MNYLSLVKLRLLNFLKVECLCLNLDQSIVSFSGIRMENVALSVCWPVGVVNALVTHHYRLGLISGRNT